MRTTITLDDGIIAEVMKVTSSTRKSEAINHALTEYLRDKKLQRLLQLRGKLRLDPDWKKQEDLELAKASRQRARRHKRLD